MADTTKPTNKEEREEWKSTDWCPDDQPCYGEPGAPVWRNNITLCANEVIDRLIADVVRLEAESSDFAKNVLSLSASLGKKIERVSELEAENERLREAADQASLKRGLQDRKEGRMHPLSELQQELLEQRHD